MLIKLAWRNVWRHRLRSFTIMASVVIGIVAGAFQISFYKSIAEQRVRTAIERETSHLQIHHPEFKKDYDINYSIGNGRIIAREISAIPSIRSVSPRIVLSGMIATPSGSSGVKISGVDLKSEVGTTALDKKLTQGDISALDKDNGVIISEKLASKMKVKLRSKIVLSFQESSGNIVSGAFRIIGLYRTVNGPYDDVNVFVSFASVNSLLGEKDLVNEIAILLSDNEKLDQVTSYISERYPTLKVEKWMDIAPEIGLTVGSIDEYNNIIIVIIMLAISFGVVNIMLMAVLERTREIGMLMAVGMNKIRLFFMILMETLFLVLTGCIPGLILSYLIISYFSVHGIDLSFAQAAYSSFGYETVTYPKPELSSFISITLFVIVTAIASSLFPARRALKLKPAESIRKL
jgi:ABC-type lipoprotein release transport system permease subunit